MVSLRFPFSFSQPPRPPHRPRASSHYHPAIAAAAAAVSAGIGLAVSLKSANQVEPSPQRLSSPMWAALSLSDAPTSTGTAVEPKTRATFPTALDGGRRLLGIGLRKNCVLGMKDINVYAFGVYADDSDVKKLSEKYGMLSVSELKENKELIADVLDQDLCMTVRLQIVYGRLNIRSVRSAFEKSVGSRIKKFSGADNKELLQSFTSLFKDEYKLPRGSVIDLSRERGYVLRTRIDGKEVGRIQSSLLCRSILDLYFGEDPFDRRAKEDIQLGLASILQKEI
uniref:Chalcone--flavanone isomerase n=1 Tax=Elaeis guineensis var. tenera TaxID=51953 RepID=A0A6I9RHM4_ELAGV|nr:fatty-acid-binding protein 1 [Elaeis guineensis]